MTEEFEKVKKHICRECGADYSQGTAKRFHPHKDFRTVTVKVPKAPLRIMYQPGYEPKATA